MSTSNWINRLRDLVEGRPKGRNIKSVILQLEKEVPNIKQLISKQHSNSQLSINQQVFDILYPERVKSCDSGNQVSFTGFGTGYSYCDKQCQCARHAKKQTMVKNHGVEHAMQSASVKEKFKKTLKTKYGSENLNRAFSTKRMRTNLQRYGVQHPLQSVDIRQKTHDSFQNNWGYSNPFDRINSPEHRSEYQHIAQQTFEKNNPHLYDYELIREVLQQNSYSRASEILGLYPSHLRNVAQRQGWTDLLPKKSSYEQLLARWLQQNNIIYRQNSRSIIPPQELDFFMPEHDLAIEINGLRWHGEKFGGKNLHYHADKTQSCNDIGIRLIQIFEDEFINHQQTVFSVIGAALGIPKSTVIRARECTISHISAKQARDFCETHHLQGYTSCTTKLGLFHNSCLVCVMTFKQHKDSVWELSRYCVSPDIAVVGGAARLFSCFLKTHEFSHIYTYSDCRYFSGNVYRTLGFAYEHTTKPGYWYFRDNRQRMHRLNFTKKRLVSQGHDSALTEWQIMQNLGYDRIWDCGHSKWIYNATNHKGTH